MSDIVLYGLGGLVFYQAYATIRVVRHKPYRSEKKRHQLLIIWIVPFVGAAIALAGLATDKDVVPQKSNDQSR
jgi:hypothetical protein